MPESFSYLLREFTFVNSQQKHEYKNSKGDSVLKNLV